MNVPQAMADVDEMSNDVQEAFLYWRSHQNAVGLAYWQKVVTRVVKRIAELRAAGQLAQIRQPPSSHGQE